MSAAKNDRIFTRDLRHYRRTYSVTEMVLGLVILVVLVGIAGWVSWKGDRPDPELFSMDPALLATGEEQIPERARASSTTPGSKHRADGASKGADERGPVPTGLAASGWSEQSVARFDPTNLYVKINGREGYYKSFGFQMLYFIALAKDDDETATVDIEMYDLGTVSNALGAYAGERQPDAQSQLSEAGIGHLARNALFLVRGRYYVRAVGSDENEIVKQQLAHLQQTLDAGLPSEAMPWGYAVFAGEMGFDPGKVGFVPESAYSLGFAKNVFNVQIDDEGAELFAVASDSESAAKALTEQFQAGFIEYYGEAADTDAGIEWVKGRYLDTYYGVTSVGSLVVGVYSAADLDSAKEQLARLQKTAQGLPTELIERAAAAAAKSAASAGAEESAGDAYGEEEGEGEGESGGAEDSAENPEEAYPEPGSDAEPGADIEGGAESGGAEPSGSEPVEEM